MIRRLLLTIGLLTPGVATAQSDTRADVEARKVLAQTCEAIAPPTAPEEVVVKNELATMLWASRVGAKLRGSAEVQAVGQMLRDLAASNYDWSKLDAAAQLAEFRSRWAPAYKLSSVVADGIAKIAVDQRMPLLSGVLVLPCQGRAEPEPQRKTLSIQWVKQKRADRRTAASARVPGATLTFVEFNNGFQNIAFQFDNGNICFGSAQAQKQLFMICGTNDARYELSRKEGGTAFLLEWVTAH